MTGAVREGGTGGGRAGEPSMNPLPYLPKISAGKMPGVGQMPQRNPAATKPQLFRNLTPLAFAVTPTRCFPWSSAPLRYLRGVQACAHQLPPSVTPIVTHHCSPVRRPPVPVCSWSSAPVVASQVCWRRGHCPLHPEGGQRLREGAPPAPPHGEGVRLLPGGEGWGQDGGGSDCGPPCLEASSGRLHRGGDAGGDGRDEERLQHVVVEVSSSGAGLGLPPADHLHAGG